MMVGDLVTNLMKLCEPEMSNPEVEATSSQSLS